MQDTASSNKTELLALARLSREQQEEVAACLVSGEATSAREGLKESAPAHQTSHTTATNVGTGAPRWTGEAETEEVMEACSHLLDSVRAWVRAQRVTNRFSPDYEPHAPPSHWEMRRVIDCADRWVELEEVETAAPPMMEAPAGSAAGSS